MLLVANFAHGKKNGKITEPLAGWHMGTHRKVLDESYPMNTNITGFR